MQNRNNDVQPGHSERYMDLALRCERRERIAFPDGYGRRVGDCGDIVEIFLIIRHGCIHTVCFDTSGCVHTMVCCNTIVRLAEGVTVDDAWNITPEHVIQYLETLPVEYHHCAELSVGALYLALVNYARLLREPWKKLYRRHP